MSDDDQLPDNPDKLVPVLDQVLVTGNGDATALADTAPPRFEAFSSLPDDALDLTPSVDTTDNTAAPLAEPCVIEAANLEGLARELADELADPITESLREEIRDSLNKAVYDVVMRMHERIETRLRERLQERTDNEATATSAIAATSASPAAFQSAQSFDSEPDSSPEQADEARTDFSAELRFDPEPDFSDALADADQLTASPALDPDLDFKLPVDTDEPADVRDSAPKGSATKRNITNFDWG